MFLTSRLGNRAALFCSEGLQEFYDFEHFFVGDIVFAADAVAGGTTRHTIFSGISGGRYFSI